MPPITYHESARAYNRRATAENGVDHFTDTTAHEGTWYGVIAVNGDAVLEAAGSVVSNSDAFGGDITLKEGIPYLMPFTTIKLTSGQVLALKR